jgi:hypothetical protein
VGSQDRDQGQPCFHQSRQNSVGLDPKKKDSESQRTGRRGSCCLARTSQAVAHSGSGHRR